MSNRTFVMSADQHEGTVPQPHRGLQLVLSPESHYLSMSPDSDGSISNPSDGEASSSPDINALECCISECSPLTNLCSTTLTQGTSTNMNQTFIATPVNGSMNFWNENMNLMSGEHHGSEKYQTFSKLTEDEGNTAGISPDSAGRDSQVSSYETSCRGSTENECCFLSSGEMVMRSNSFCFEDQSVLVVSSLDESSLSPAAGRPALPADSNLLSPALPTVCEKSIERVTEENTGNPCLGMTFTHSDNWELLTVENDIATSSSPVPLPSENEVGLLMTFISETSAESRKETKFASAEGDPMPYFLGAITPEQSKNSATLTPNPVQESDKDIHTSTPVQNTGNQIPSLPAFSQSPCIGSASSPKLNAVKEQQSPGSPKQRLVTRVPPSASKVKRIEIKKFPKSDFSYVKSKVITRFTHQIAVQGPASQQKPSQVNVNNKHTDVHRATTIRVSPAKTRSSNAVSATTKMLSGPQRRANTGVNVIQSSGHTVVNGQDKIRASPPEKHLVATDHASAIQCSNASFETKQTASNQESDASAQQAGSQTFCLSSVGKTPVRSSQKDLKPTVKKGVSEKIEVRSDTAVGQDRSPVLKTRPRCSSESSTSRPPKEKRRTLTYSASFTVSKADCHHGHARPGNLNSSSRYKRPVQAEEANGCTENSSREAKKISLVAEFDNGKTRFRGRPSPRRAVSPRPATLSDRQRQGSLARDECRTSKAMETTQSKQRSITGIQRAQPTGEQTHGTATVKPQWCGFRAPQTTTRPSLMGPPPTPASRLPRKTLGPARSLNEASVHSDLSHSTGNAQVSGGAAHQQTPVKSVVLKARVISTPGKSTGPTLTTTCKPAVSSDKGTSYSTFSPLRRSASARFVRSSSGPVDKNKSKPSSRQQPPQQPASQLNRTNGCQDGVPASVTECGRKDKNIQQLKGLLTASNLRFEAVAIILQKTLAERDEATKQCRELSQELVNLRGELVCSVHSSERLEKEKEELRVALEDALQRLEEQHQNDLSELEQRLQAFYQAEWDKVHLTYQEEADKCKTLMQQQMVELKASHEATKLELENSHVEQLQCVKQQYETSLEELRNVHNKELQSLGKTLKDAEDALSRQIQELTAENNALIEKLTAEENRRKALAEKSQKDSHTQYLEYELESLKVVLDIKTKQLHQQEKKLMEIDKLTEKNLKLDESLNKVTQENEDLKARMERHAALSRQLSTEQAVLQESLHKESKVNKRLSMENEELLWKLHNGDLSSPRKVSPSSTSPSHSFSFQSPRSSGVFSSPPVSPR